MINFILICLCLASNNYKVDGRMMASMSQEEDLELENQLRLMNKPPLKTIQTAFGHIVDCIDINKQLVFDNPLLKNHKIQLRSSLEHARKTLNEDQRSARSSRIEIEEDLCPIGTIPVRRTTKDDLIRIKHLSNKNGMLIAEAPGNHFAAVTLNRGANITDVYYGIKGIINVYNPTVTRKEQMSGAYLYLAKGPNSIMAGWQVYPEIHGDVKTYFFTAWDPATNNWWVRLQDKDLGYFPATLFADMTSAEEGGWYGRTMTPTYNSPSPPMGSGHFPDHTFGHACYIRNMTFQKYTREDIEPTLDLVGIYKDMPSCYEMSYTGYVDDSLRYAMQFGGPGGNCGY
ncbi:hypothetical protein RIF29_37534 [Crotalaria pallida]|uniref:Neprosin PEP catalytic domain-containing protein n=1 Tax=Crotalaria pallida TaxID=3830 RepID=A0AAN9HUW8_CROPI